LNELARHDANKHHMINAGIVPMYMEVVRDTKQSSVAERAEAMKGIWLMTFVKAGVLVCRNTEGCIECKLFYSLLKKF